MALELNDHFCSCSVAALNYVSAQSPEQCIKQFVSRLKSPTFNQHTKKYENGYFYGYYIHVFFSGPKHEGWSEAHRDHHWSAVGSCDALAAYIREQKLGPVVETEPRWNHRHASRPKGQGDVVAYVWSPDPDALEAWHKEHK